MWQDVRYALRTMRRAPGFTAVAVLSLALGMGANTAIFSLVDAVMLHVLPVHEPARLVESSHRFAGEPALNAFSWRAYRYYVEHNHVFSGLIGVANPPVPGRQFSVRTEGLEPEKVTGVYVTGNFFNVLGVQPAAGRLIAPDDDRPGAAANVAVVSWPLRTMLGKRIIVDDVPLTVIGVAPRGFAGLRIDVREDLWLPIAIEPAQHPKNNFMESRGGDLALVGRLKPGVPIEQARAEMTILDRQSLEENVWGNRFVRAAAFEMEPAGTGIGPVRERFAKPLLVLMGVVGLLLLIACTNIASLLLARGAGRQREMALRVSLGATRSQLARLVFTESLLLSLAGTLAGILLAYFGAAALLRIIASGREPVELHVTPDSRILLFTAALAVATAVLFGLAPALRACGTAPASALQGALGAAGETRLRRFFAKSLVVAQVALSLILLAGAGLFVRHLSSLYAGLGFQRERILLVTLDPSRSGYRREQLAVPYRQLLERLESIPGVRSTTLSGVTPISGAGASNAGATVEGYVPKAGEFRYLAENWVAPKYFETYGTPLLAGRDFSFEDAGRPRVAIVNRAMARFYFGDEGSAIGKHVWFDRDERPYEIIGVAGDTKYHDADEPPERIIYFNAFQEGRLFSNFSIRTSIAPGAIAAEVRRAVSDVAKPISVGRITTLTDQVDASLVPQRLIVILSEWFGALGCLLAAIGIYGLLAYTVARRTGEIGIRMALGATRGGVTGMVLRDALGMVFAGLLAGVPIAIWGRRFAASLVPGLRVTVTASLVFAAAAMIVVALVAAWVPARRAAAVEPMDALRHE